MTAGHIQVAQHDGVQVIRLLGDVRLNLCTAFDKYIRQVVSKGNFDNVTIDLSDAEGVDSTSLGQLAKISILSREKFSITPTIFSPDPSITRILMSMGFDMVFHIVEEPLQDASEFREWADDTIDEDEAREQIISAHKALMDLNDSNRNTFSELVETLECSRQA
ncbi:STAS domain-containing protein [Oceanobacter kriegii]|uniref:STAS domain-containing protein n=1 Tax=Oceanobacter kriegii TaxID=64972 RepID=UPI0004045109|nr:STAS domain-containing protein [Oceanobacter kriegii]